MSGEMGPYSEQCGCVGDPWSSSRSRRPLQQRDEGWVCSTAAHHPAEGTATVPRLWPHT